MLTLEQAQSLVVKEINSLNIPHEPENLYQPVRYILSIGGKKIRPSLVLLGANAFTDDIDPAISPAIGIEIFHNFTLLHDDLMDNSEIRRGMQTVHLKWNPNISILSGDVMSIMANDYISRVSEKFLKKVLASFNRTAIEVCEGQMLDMDFEKREDVSIKEYIRMIELKTSVLIAASLEIGALSVGADESAARDLYIFGLNLGIAFQLQDDLLDSFGDTRTFGKKVGNDILTNKKTYLMISLMNLSSLEDKDLLISILAKKDFIPEKKISEVLRLYNKYDIKNLTQEKINEYFNLAVEKLSKIDLPENRKKTLWEFSEELMGRNA